VIHTHPVTGKKALYVNHGYCTELEAAYAIAQRLAQGRA
jgi:hypothetical protein